MKNDAVFKRTFNAILDHLSKHEQGGGTLPSENQLAQHFDVSRTTIRKVLSTLAERGLIRRQGVALTTSHPPGPTDYFARADTVATSDRVERKFMEWMLRGDARPGDLINSLELARQFNVSTSAIREYLNRFHRFGLVERRPNSGWVFRGFTVEFALELFEVRELFELRSAKTFARIPPTTEPWTKLTELRSEHVALADQLDSRYQDFSDLDDRFHRLINNASQNRFMADFYDIISLIFHYHYQWRKVDEKERNAVAIDEHLAYIDALCSGSADRVEAACRRHLRSARKTLLASIS
jgi:DNA-binding GntR family transcriptional regulator